MRRLVPAVLLLTLAGCDRRATYTVTGGPVRLIVRNLRYDRQNVRVQAGVITFSVTNEGPDPTNFRVRRHQRALASITTLQPGQKGVTRAELKPGTYVMYSSVGRHETLGEYGRLTVTRKRR
jgi:hypothetical protein